MARVSELDRFMSHVLKAESGCWLWTAFKMPSGYGNFRTPCRHELAHRAAYRIFCGDLEPGKDVMHSCDYSSCVNPEHLTLGTRRDNMIDAKQKGRNARGITHGHSKLSESEVKEIRKAKGTQRTIAGLYSISKTTVHEIKSGRKWAHLI